MATENYIEQDPSGNYRVYVDPIDASDESYAKELDTIPVPSDPADGEDPETGLGDFKAIINKISLNFIIADDTNNPDTVSERYNNLRRLYGYNNDASEDATSVRLHYNGNDFYGKMSRLTFNKNGGEPFYNCTLEVTIGVGYEDL